VRLVWVVIPLVLFGIGVQESFAEPNFSNSTNTDKKICGDHLCSESPIIRYTPYRVGLITDPKYALPPISIYEYLRLGVPIHSVNCGNHSLQIIISDVHEKPICVTSKTAEKLETRGWGMSLKSIIKNTESNFGEKLFEPINNFTISYYYGGETEIGPDFQRILDSESDEYYLDAYVNNTFWKHWFEQTYPNLTVDQALGIQPWPEVCFDHDVCFVGQNNLVRVINEIPFSIFKIDSYDDDLVLSYFDSLCKRKNNDHLNSTNCVHRGGSNINGINDYSEKHSIKHHIHITDENIFQIATISFLKQNETWIVLSSIEELEISFIEERTIIEKFKKIVNSFTIGEFQHRGI